MRISALPIDSLPGIDLPGFLDRFEGNFALLAALLPRFVEDTETRIALVAQHLESGKLDEMKAVLHQLRGAAANIGANEVSNLAGRAEEALAQDGFEALQPLPAALAKAMIRLREAAAIVAAQPAIQDQAPAGDGAQIAELLEMLRDHNMRALDLVRDCAPALVALIGRQEADALIVSVESLDFEAACGKLARLGPGGVG